MKWSLSISNQNRKRATYVLIVLIPVYTGWVYIPILSDIEQITKPLKPLNFTESIDFNTVVQGTTYTSGTAVEVALNITYPLGILVVNENVSIVATAFLSITPQSNNLTSFYVGFQNGLLSPPMYQKVAPSLGETLVPLIGYMNFTNPFGQKYPNGGNAIDVANMTIEWPVEVVISQ